jgi:hypothetical protein
VGWRCWQRRDDHGDDRRELDDGDGNYHSNYDYDSEVHDDNYDSDNDYDNHRDDRLVGETRRRRTHFEAESEAVQSGRLARE